MPARRGREKVREGDDQVLLPRSRVIHERGVDGHLGHLDLRVQRLAHVRPGDGVEDPPERSQLRLRRGERLQALPEISDRPLRLLEAGDRLPGDGGIR